MTASSPDAAAPLLGHVGASGDLSVLDDPVELRRFTRMTTGPGGAAIADSSFRIGGMYCSACAGTIEQALSGVPGVLSATVNASGERARVHWDPARTTAAALVQVIRQAGYQATPDAALEARESRKQEHRTALWRLFVAAFCAMQVMMMATPSYVTQGDELAPDLRQLLNWGSWLLTLPVLIFSAGPFFRSAWHSLRQRRIGMDVPVSLGIAVTFVASSGATFSPQGIFGRDVYFDSLTMFVAFLLAGRWLRADDTDAPNRADERGARMARRSENRTAKRSDNAASRDASPIGHGPPSGAPTHVAAMDRAFLNRAPLTQRAEARGHDCGARTATAA